MAATELVELARFRIPGKPLNWSNQARSHWAQSYLEKREWKERSILLALQARAQARLPQPSRELDTHRQVEVVLHSARLYDDDGAYASVKPIVDGLKGILIVDDRQLFCQILVRQEKVKHYSEQFVEVIVRARAPGSAA